MRVFRLHWYNLPDTTVLQIFDDDKSNTMTDDECIAACYEREGESITEDFRSIILPKPNFVELVELVEIIKGIKKTKQRKELGGSLNNHQSEIVEEMLNCDNIKKCDASKNYCDVLNTLKETARRLEYWIDDMCYGKNAYYSPALSDTKVHGDVIVSDPNNELSDLDMSVISESVVKPYPKFDSQGHLI